MSPIWGQGSPFFCVASFISLESRTETSTKPFYSRHNTLNSTALSQGPICRWRSQRRPAFFLISCCEMRMYHPSPTFSDVPHHIWQTAGPKIFWAEIFVSFVGRKPCMTIFFSRPWLPNFVKRRLLLAQWQGFWTVAVKELRWYPLWRKCQPWSQVQVYWIRFFYHPRDSRGRSISTP